MPLTVWQILNMSKSNDLKKKLCEAAETCLEKFVKSRELILGGL